MPLYLFHTMVQKIQNDQKLKSRGPALNLWPLKRSFLLYMKFAFFFLTKPCGTKLFSGPLEASRKRPVDGVSTVRRLSLRLTRFSCVLVMDRKKLWFPWPFSKRKMKCACTLGSRSPATFSESAEWSCACPIFRREKFAEPTRYVYHEMLPVMKVSSLWNAKIANLWSFVSLLKFPGLQYPD